MTARELFRWALNGEAFLRIGGRRRDRLTTAYRIFLRIVQEKKAPLYRDRPSFKGRARERKRHGAE